MVSVVTCGDAHDCQVVKAAVRECLDLLGGLDSIVSAGDCVLIKPNVLGPFPYKTGVVTNPAVVRTLIIMAKEAGAKEVIVGESSLVGADTGRSFDVSGIGAATREAGGRLMDFKKDEPVPVVVPGGRVLKRTRVPKTAMYADVIINVPVAKTHMITGVTLSLKNAKGFEYDSDKKRLHKWGLIEGIVDLNRILLPDLVVVDGTIGMEGPGPSSGEPADLGVILASTDAVAADATAAGIMGFDPDEVEHIRLAGSDGLGVADPHRIRVVGHSIAEVRKPFKRPAIDFAAYPNFQVIESGACSGCFHALQSLVASLESEGRLDLLDGYTIVLGQTVRLTREQRQKDRLFLIGRCTGQYKGEGAFVPGCPPQRPTLLEKLIAAQD